MEVHASKHVTLAFACSLMLWAPLHAQPQELTFEQVQLPSDYVFAIAQDAQGFLWVGTQGGLFKYDGYRVTTYRHEPSDTTSLSSSWIESLYVDREGTLWVGTMSGLNRFDAATETFTRFRHDSRGATGHAVDGVIAILEDRHNELWIGTHSGLHRLDREHGTFVRYRHDPDDPTSLSDDQVRAIYEDRQGTLWIGCGDPLHALNSATPSGMGGLNRFDRETGTFRRYVHDPEDPHSLSDNRVTTLLEDSRGTFWVGTWGDGLHTMDRAQGTFTRYPYDPAHPEKLSAPPFPKDAGDETGVKFVYEDHSGVLWIGGFNAGLGRYDPVTKRLTRHVFSSASNRIWTIQESRDGTLWIGTLDCLYKFSAAKAPFQHYAAGPRGSVVYSFLESKDGMLWVGTGPWIDAAGLIRLDRKTGQVVRYAHDPEDPHSLSDNYVLSLREDREGILWVGTAGGGLNRFDRRTGTFTRYQHDPEDPHSLAPGLVYDVYEDREGVLWVGTRGSLNRFDPQQGAPGSSPGQGFTRYLHIPDDSRSLTSTNRIHEDREGGLWVGGALGLYRFDRATQTFTRYEARAARPGSLSSNDVTALYEDRDGVLWVGTEFGGLNRFDRSTGTFTHINTGNSRLPSDNIRGILGDAQGNLWISTANDLVKYNPQRNSVRRFDLDPHVQVGQFTYLASYENRRGELFFGGQNGFITFFPDDIPDNPNPPEVVLTGLSLFDQPVRPGPESPLKRPLWESREVEFAYDQNTFSIDYVGLHFQDPAGNRYAYMLEGYDEAWRQVETDRRASYYKVPPGRYVFRVKATNSDGFWNDEGAFIGVVILPPWWRTPWAYLLYGLLFTAVVVAGSRLQRRRLIRKERERAREHELEQARQIEAMNVQLRAHEAQLESQNRRLLELDQMKSRFFANISHEFRTPLTLILGPLQDLLEGSLDADQLARQASLMQRNAARLLRLINQLLDLSKLEAGAMHLRAREADLVPFLRNLVLSFSSRAERERITLSFHGEQPQIPLYFDPDHLEKVVTNLLANALKFTGSCGKIRVSAAVARGEAGAYAEILVKDTGVGIPPEQLPLVFDRFYQVDGSATRAHEGTGIGLALARELVELHGGVIEVKSEVGFGSTFTIRLPLGKEHLQPEQIVEEDGDGAGAARPDRIEWIADETERPAAEDAPDGAAEKSAVILIVEDNADLRAYLRRHLGHRYRVEEAADGVEGLAQAQRLHPALIITDVMMPHMDGFALCRALKTDPELNDVPVVLLTARADEESRLEALGLGADDYLAKPFSEAELMARAENLIELRRLLRQRYSAEVVIGPSEVVVRSHEAALLERVRAVVEAKMGHSNFSVDWLAAEVGQSRRQLQRRLRDLTNLSAAGYIRMMRLERAEQLLAQRWGTVAEVAYAVGFQDVDHFSRLFKQVFGATPSAYSAKSDKGG